MDIESGDLSMSLDTGWVHRRIGEDLESLGPICDQDACPFGLERDWESLLDAWNDSRGGGHRREAEWGWYERLSVTGAN